MQRQSLSAVIIALFPLFIRVVSGMACRRMWMGTSPFCEGLCPPGWREIDRSDSGDGAKCFSGSKVFCEICDELRDMGCHPTETDTECWGLVLMCKNVERTTVPDMTRVCNTFACGPCLGIGSTAFGVRQRGPVLPFGPNTCLEGFVWREANADDQVCVTPNVRMQTQADNAAARSRINTLDHTFGTDTCLEGFVWREAFPGDHVCVLLVVKLQAKWTINFPRPDTCATLKAHRSSSYKIVVNTYSHNE